jgi:hypothetical protein
MHVGQTIAQTRRFLEAFGVNHIREEEVQLSLQPCLEYVQVRQRTLFCRINAFDSVFGTE